MLTSTSQKRGGTILPAFVCEDLMKTLPLAARLYIFVVWGVAAILVALTLLKYPPSPNGLALLIPWLVLFVLADYFDVEFELGEGQRLRMTVAEAAVMSLLVINNASGVLVIIVGTFIAEMLRRRPWHRALFNAAHRGITYLLVFFVYAAVYGLDQVYGPGNV